MNNNSGYYGISLSGSTQNNLMGNSGSSSLVSSKVAAGIGAGIQGAGAILDLFSLGSERQSLTDKKNQVQQFSTIKMKQIKADQDLLDFQSANQSRQLYGKQLSQAGVSGASLSSATVFADTTSTFIGDYNKRFINEMNATSAEYSLLLQKSQQLEDIYDRENALGARAFGDIIQTGIAAGSIAAL
ncbi:MAG: hypothetical protein LW807_07185 [Proteobacteria bacterium]|nr:hypothetical protein [Pseudomonadota bacterium]